MLQVATQLVYGKMRAVSRMRLHGAVLAYLGTPLDLELERPKEFGSFPICVGV